jgi:hypothetical protein
VHAELGEREQYDRDEDAPRMPPVESSKGSDVRRLQRKRRRR